MPWNGIVFFFNSSTRNHGSGTWPWTYEKRQFFHFHDALDGQMICLNVIDFPVCCKCGGADLLPTSSNKSSLANYSEIIATSPELHPKWWFRNGIPAPNGLNSGVDGLGIFAICPDLGLNLQYFAQNFLSVLRWLAKRPWKGYHNQGHHDL